MNIKNIVIKALFVGLIAVVAATPMLRAEVSVVRGEICEVGDEPPIFPGRVLYALHDFMEKNFVYPREAWLAEKKHSAHARVVICKDGKVRQVEFRDVSHPALVAELERVIDKMTWFPGYKDGKVANCRYEMEIPLQPFFTDNTIIPFGYVKMVDKADNYATKLTNTNKPVSRNPELDNFIRDAAELFPEHANTSVAFARMAASEANKNAGINAIDSCLANYARLNIYDSISPEDKGDDIRPGYCGRTEAAVATLRHAIYSYYNHEDTEAAYTKAVGLLDHRMADGDISRAKTRKEIEASERRIKRMRLSMVREFTHYRIPIGIETEGWQKVSRFYSVDQISNSLSYWAEKGRIDNAQVIQLSELIRKEYESRQTGKKAKGELLNLWGTRAMLEWMQGGNEAVDAYIAEVEKGEPSKALSKHFAKLRENLDKNADMLADRDAAIQSIACLVPPEGVDAKEFYARRKVVEKVFPLRWLLEI